MSTPNPEKALIFRITHVSNLPWTLENGLHCSSSDKTDPNYIQIGNAELISRRRTRDVPVPPNGSLSDYVPFYFTLAILVSFLREVHEQGIPFVFTDRHAYLQAAEFYNDLDKLDRIDWPRLQTRDFRRDPEDPGKVERYQAEALIYQHLPLSALLGIICYREDERRKIEEECGKLRVTKQVVCRPGWYL